MKWIQRWQCLLGVAGLGVVLSSLTGCQTWVAGMTLPSGRYLEHPPQYFPPSPPFPLSRELAYQQTIAAQGAPGAAVPAPLPAPVVPPPPMPGVPVMPGRGEPGMNVPPPPPAP